MPSMCHDFDNFLPMQSVPKMKIQMQLTWLHVKMLDQSVKTQADAHISQYHLILANAI